MMLSSPQEWMKTSEIQSSEALLRQMRVLHSYSLRHGSQKERKKAVGASREFTSYGGARNLSASFAVTLIG